MFFALVFLSAVIPCAANTALSVDKIQFKQNDKNITYASAGEISFEADISGSGTVFLISYVYDGEKLLDISTKRISAQSTLYSSGSVTVPQSAQKPFVYALVWNEAHSPLAAVRIAPKNHVPSGVDDAIKRFDSINDKGIVDFFISLYDPVSGGFYVSPSAYNTPGFEAELEATATIMVGLPTMGLMTSNPNLDPDIPDGFLDKLKEFFLSRQSEADGYFYDPCYGNQIIETKRERSSSKTISVLDMMGVEPLYPTYIDRLTENASLYDIPEHFSSEEKYVAWMENKNWTTGTYLTGNEITNSIPIAMALGYEDAAAEVIIKKQNPKTGLWGTGEITADSTNGALKLSAALRTLGVKYPYADKAIDSIIYYIENETSPEHICTIWNPLILICNIRATHNGLLPLSAQKKLESKMLTLLDKTYSHLIKMRTDDGGYKYYPNSISYDAGGGDGCPGIDKDGNIEGNYNSTVIGSYLMRNTVYSVAGVNCMGAWHQYKSYFWEEIGKKMQSVNPKYEICQESYQEDFEDVHDISEISDTWGFVIQEKNDRPSIVNMEDNKCLRIKLSPTTAEYGGYDRFTSNFKIPGGKTYTLMCDFMVSSESARPVFSISLGPRAVYLSLLRDSVIGKDGSHMIAAYKTSKGGFSTSDSKVLKENIEKGAWHNIKIVYTPLGKTDTLTSIYLDNEHLLTTNEYFNGGFSERLPVEKIPFIKIYAFDRSCNMEIYLDNLSVVPSEN